MIELKNIHKEFDGSVILEDVSATINKGDVICIIGPSGCGKSTLLNCINLLNRATSGQVIFEGIDMMDRGCNLPEYRKKIGMVFQNFNLFAHMTVIENVMNPQITLLKRTKQEAYNNAVKYLSLVGMSEKTMRYPDELSGGQKQRVAIARTLAMDPELILMDEPTSALDPTMVGEVSYVIRKLAKQGRTMVIVTHEMSLAREISNRIFFMDEKGIYEEGPTSEIFGSPKRDKTRQFINKIRELEITIDSSDFDNAEVVGRINEFGNKLFLPHSLIQKAQLLFEESVVSVLFPSIAPDALVNVRFEYDSVNKGLSMTIYHHGEIVFPSDEKSYSQIIIDNISREIEFKEVIF